MSRPMIRGADKRAIAALPHLIDCPNCKHSVVAKFKQPKASCPRCGNVWNWMRPVRRMTTARGAA